MVNVVLVCVVDVENITNLCAVHVFCIVVCDPLTAHKQMHWVNERIKYIVYIVMLKKTRAHTSTHRTGWSGELVGLGQ